MGISINVNTKQDYSYLFSSLNKSDSTGMSSLLGDYASIKNGSYGKLMKAYYKGNAKDEVNTLAKKNSTDVKQTQEVKNLTKVSANTDALKTSADKLLEKGSDSVYEKSAEDIYQAVSDFVKDYNSVVSSAEDINDSLTINRVGSMESNTTLYAKQLANVGITVKSDNTLAIDKDAFLQADMKQVQSLFQGAGSFGYQTSAQASLIDYAADHAANQNSTYTQSGLFNSSSTGNLFNSYF